MNFIEEYEKLKKKFPRPAQIANSVENCEWADHIYSSQNCYWCFDSTEISDCLYDFGGWQEKGAIDTLWNAICENCFEVADSINSNSCYFSHYMERCYNMYYSFNCGDCHDCFGCSQLMNKSFCIFNGQYTEEEYRNKLPELKKMSAEEAIAKAKEVENKFPKIQSYFSDNENSEYVDYVYKSRNSYYCFDATLLEDCGYVTNSNESKDTWESTFCMGVEHCCEAVDSNECFNCFEIQDCSRCYDSAYLYHCEDTNNCFMCTNLNNAKHCILNIQYTPDEYAKKVAEIKAEIGQKFIEQA